MLGFCFLIWEFVHNNTDTLRTKKPRAGLEICSSPGQTRWESQHSLFLVSTSFQDSFQQNSNWNCETLVWHPGGCEGWQSVHAQRQRHGWDHLGSWARMRSIFSIALHHIIQSTGNGDTWEIYFILLVCTKTRQVQVHPKGQSTQVKVGTCLCTCRNQTKVSALQIQMRSLECIFLLQIIMQLQLN